MTTQIRLVTHTSDAAVRAFGALQRRVYFEPETLIPGELIGRLLAASDRQRKNLLLVAEEGRRLLGGTLFHATMPSQCGFSSFMGIAAEARGRGLARQLHEARFEALDDALGGPCRGVFIDVVAPDRLAPERVEAERRFGSDPFARRRIFQALGFRKVDLPYHQPVGGPDGGPLTTLDLLWCPRHPAESVPTDAVLKTLLAYWTPWLGEARARREVDRLGALAGGESVPLRAT